MAGKVLEFDRHRVQRLQDAYAAAIKSEAETFTFEGNVLLTTYAKYLLQYLWERFDGVEDVSVLV